MEMKEELLAEGEKVKVGIGMVKVVTRWLGAVFLSTSQYV